MSYLWLQKLFFTLVNYFLSCFASCKVNGNYLQAMVIPKISKMFLYWNHLSIYTKSLFYRDTCKIRCLGCNHMFVAFSALLAKFKIVNQIFLYALERREHTNYHRLFGSRSEWKACAFKKGMYNIIQILK